MILTKTCSKRSLPQRFFQNLPVEVQKREKKIWQQQNQTRSKYKCYRVESQSHSWYTYWQLWDWLVALYHLHCGRVWFCCACLSEKIILNPIFKNVFLRLEMTLNIYNLQNIIILINLSMFRYTQKFGSGYKPFFKMTKFCILSLRCKQDFVMCHMDSLIPSFFLYDEVLILSSEGKWQN